jgi:hypothetical protein
LQQQQVTAKAKIYVHAVKRQTPQRRNDVDANAGSNHFIDQVWRVDNEVVI